MSTSSQFFVWSDRAPARDLPEYLPARMVNEFVYCPRLFFYEWVEGSFRESADTIEGQAQHQRVDREGAGLPEPAALLEAEAAGDLKTQAITLSSERYRVIAKLDLVEVTGGQVTPVDYKKGRPAESADGPQAWPADRVQLAIQGLVLREAGYRCKEGLLFYAATRQRVRVTFDERAEEEARRAIEHAWELARYGGIPAPLVDSPKCPGCSLHPICLPDEVTLLLRQPPPRIGAGSEHAAARLSPSSSSGRQLTLFGKRTTGDGDEGEDGAPEPRRLMTPRHEQKPVYLNTQGLRVGRSGAVLQVKEKDKVVQELRLPEIGQVNLFGNIQITTQAIQSLCEADVPVCFFSQGGWFYGMTGGLSAKNLFLRQAQYELAAQPWFCRELARALVVGKIRNQRTMLQRNHIEPEAKVLQSLKELAASAARAISLEELLGIEGSAARLYFGSLQGMLKAGEDASASTSDSVSAWLTFDFTGRNRRPPRDPVNALLSLAYSLLSKDLTIACGAVGLDPMLGFYHQPRAGRPALAVDLMEPFRPLVADSAVLSAINTRMVTAGDFVRAGGSVGLKPEGRKALYRAYESRMDTLVTHPLFSYRVSYRRLLEIQVRLLAKYLQGEVPEYPVFVTR